MYAFTTYATTSTEEHLSTIQYSTSHRSSGDSYEQRMKKWSCWKEMNIYDIWIGGGRYEGTDALRMQLKCQSIECVSLITFVGIQGRYVDSCQ